MAVPEEDKSLNTDSLWNKTWVFLLAFLCVLSLGGLGTWGRIRMLEDGNAKLAQKLEHETVVHLELEKKWKKSFRQKNKQVTNIRQEIEVANRHFQKLNASMKHIQAVIDHDIEQAGVGPSQFLSECKGVVLPSGFQVEREGQQIFPYDVSRDTTGLHMLLKSDASLQSLYNVTMCIEKAGLFSQPTFPWAQWTWLQALLEEPSLAGNFTEWGVGGGGSSLFLAALARLRGSTLVGFDSWADGVGVKREKQFGQVATQCGLSVPANAELFNLSRGSIAWPTAGHDERLAFTHIDSDDYKTTLGILNAVYNSTAEGGIIAVDNFFHPSGGSKRAVQDFFTQQSPGKLPLIYPVFPGFSVLIFKDRFADPRADDIRPNSLDGNYYSFKYIKGQPQILDSVNRSVVQLAGVHRNAKADPHMNGTAVCWLGLALHNAKSMRDFIQSSNDSSHDFEAADMFTFMAGNTQLAAKIGVA